MKVKTEDFVRAVEAMAPPELAYEWDNSGLLIRCADEVSRVLITLDVTDYAIDEALKKGCEMILAHHPLIFEPAKSIDIKDPTGALVTRLIKEGISLYCAHTSFDRAKGGMGDMLAEKLGLKDVITISGAGEDLLKIGKFDKPFIDIELITHVKKALEADLVRVSNLPEIKTDTIAVVPGSGGGFIKAAKAAGAGALVTGEAKHHHFLEANMLGMLLIEAGHYHTERCFTEEVFMSLQSILNELQLYPELIRAGGNQAPYEYI